MLKTFCDWRLRLNDQKREALASNLARRYYERTLAQRSWAAWHSLVENKWKQRVEKACQAKAQEVCIELTNDYEAKLASANEALAAVRAEVARLSTERERYEETMKKAFMRGVCALNMEAMAMFHESSEGNADALGSQEFSGTQPHVAGIETAATTTTIPQEPVFSSAPPGAPVPRVVTSIGGASRPTSSISTSVARTASGVRGKTISAKVTARTDTGRSLPPQGSNTLVPPMSSVMVERHQPVTKQTIGHAMANRYPRGSGQPSIVQRKIAGQFPHSAPNVQTVKVVD
jgi:centrosomal protein POC5